MKFGSLMKTFAMRQCTITALNLFNDYFLFVLYLSCISRIFFFQPSSVFTRHKKFYSHPPLLPGEQIILQQDHVTCVDTFDDIAKGILHITTYRVIFAGSHDVQVRWFRDIITCTCNGKVWKVHLVVTLPVS